MTAYRRVIDMRVSLWAWWEVVAAHHRVHDCACCHLQADCLESGISSGPLRLITNMGNLYLLGQPSDRGWLKNRTVKTKILSKLIRINFFSKQRFFSTVLLNLCNFSNMTVSQGSEAMSLKCGGICNDHFVANFVLSLAVK